MDQHSEAVEAKQALGRAVKLERELHQLSKTTSFFDPNVRALRSQLRDQYVSVLLSDYSLAKAKDVEACMWKSVFYKPIEEFRKRIRKAQESGRPAVELLHKATKTLQGFLTESIAFYKLLVMRLQATYMPVGVELQLPPGTNVPSGSPQKKDTDASSSVARSLLFLGDLTRYDILYSSSDGARKMSESDWTPAADYYIQAAKVNMHNGQPHNQLAVLATYTDDELGAVYHYARALAVKTPFMTARDNLVLLFEKSRQRAALLDKCATNGGGRGGGRRNVSGRGSANGKGTPPHVTMATRYVRIVGILFTKTSLETLNSIAEAAATDLNLALARGGKAPAQVQARLSDQLFKLCAVLVFSLYNVQWVPENHSPGYSEMVQRTVLQRSAMTVMFGFMVQLIKALLPDGEQRQVSTSHPALPALCIGLQWLASHPDHALPDDPDAAELKARAAFYNAAGRLLQHSGSIAAGIPEPVATALPEDCSLRGFLPLCAVHEKLSEWKDMPQDCGSYRIARVVADLLKTADTVKGFEEASLQKASWRSASCTKEWKLLKEEIARFRCAAAAPLEGEKSEIENRGEAREACISRGNQVAKDPMEEDEFEEEVILFKPVQQQKGSRDAVQAASELPPPTSNAAPTVSSAPFNLWGVPAMQNQGQSSLHQQYALPWMQGIQIGFGGSATDLPSDGNGTEASPVNNFLVNGSSNIADHIQDMGNSLVADLGLEASQRDPIAPPVSKSNRGEFRGGGLYSPQFFERTGAAPASGNQGVGSFFSAATSTFENLRTSAPPSFADLAHESTGNDLGDGYGWLEALEARASGVAPQECQVGYTQNGEQFQGNGAGWQPSYLNPYVP